MEKGILLETGVGGLGRLQGVQHVTDGAMLDQIFQGLSTTHRSASKADLVLHNAKRTGLHDRLLGFRQRGLRCTMGLLAASSKVPQPNPDPQLYKLVMHPRCVGGGQYSAFNTATPESESLITEFAAYLGHYFSDIVTGVIMGNEVNSHCEWNNCGATCVEQFVSEYAKALAAAYRGLCRSQNGAESRIKLFCCLDSHYAAAFTPGAPMNSFPGKRFLELLIKDPSIVSGRVPWHIAYHPYPADLANCTIWEDDLVNLFAPHQNTPRISFQNMTVLAQLLEGREFLLPNGQRRRIICTESGFHCTPRCEDAQLRQAAAFALAWRCLKNTGVVDIFFYHRECDHPQEQDLLFGILDLNHWVRPHLLAVFNAAGGPREQAVFAPYLARYGLLSREEEAEFLNRHHAPADFDASRYSSLYPDVASSRYTPMQHYWCRGFLEGRSYTTAVAVPVDFDAQAFLALPENAELRQRSGPPPNDGDIRAQAARENFARDAFAARYPQMCLHGGSQIAHAFAQSPSSAPQGPKLQLQGGMKPSLPADFDAEEYLSLYSDLERAAPNNEQRKKWAADHFLAHGCHEGRAYRRAPVPKARSVFSVIEPAALKCTSLPVPDFDAETYLSLNPDLQPLAPPPTDAYRRLLFAGSHFNDYGHGEGRPYRRPGHQQQQQQASTPNVQQQQQQPPPGGLPSDFDPEVYLSLYDDLMAAVPKGDWAQRRTWAAHHYLHNGRQEGRKYRRDNNSGGGSPSSNNDNPTKTTHHQNPLLPGDFDAERYIALYPDLVAAAPKQGQQQRKEWGEHHYLQYGKNEGRRYR